MKKYKYSEITPEQIYNKRRKFIKSIGLGVGSLSLSSIPFLITAYSQNKTDLTLIRILPLIITIMNLELERVILLKIHKNLILNHGMLLLKVK